MSQTRCNMLVHVVFSTRDRTLWIDDEIREPLKQYLSGVLREMDSPQIALEIVPNHVHILLVLSKTRSIGSVVGEAKRATSRWIHNQGPEYAKFAWQAGYYADSVSESGKYGLTRYIRNQMKHHGYIA